MRPFPFVVLLLSGCSVVDAPYPIAWDLPAPAPSNDCRRFEGIYADRGEAPGQAAEPSLTRELFGADSPWQHAKTVQLKLVSDTEAEVTVQGGKALSHRFSAKAGDFQCEGGTLTLRHRRWVTSDLMSGRETVRIRLHAADPYLTVHVFEATTGVMFMVVPLSGESARWYRFRRLAANEHRR